MKRVVLMDRNDKSILMNERAHFIKAYKDAKTHTVTHEVEIVGYTSMRKVSH